MRCQRCLGELPAATRYCPHCGLRAPGKATGPLAAPSHGERRVVTMVRVNVARFAMWIERLGTEEATALLNASFTDLSDVVYRFGGVVDRYVGDAMVALFGVPVAHEDDPERALAAAIEMQAAIRHIARDVEALYGTTWNLRVGVHTDLMVTGEVGSELKRDFTVLGDGWHVLKALEEHAPAGSVLVSQATSERAAHAFRFREHTSVLPEAHAEAVATFLCEAEAAPVPVDDTDFVGRQPERKALLTALQRARSGAAIAVHLRADGGLGKTALMRQVLAESALGTEVVVARCLPSEFPVPFDLGRRLVRVILGLDEAAVTEDSVEAALAALPGPERVDPQATQVLYHMLTGRSVPALDVLEPEHRQQMMFRVLTELVLLQARQRLVALVLEDLHWCDDSSAAWLQSFYLRLVQLNRPAWVVLTFRPGERIVPPPPRGVQAVDVKLMALTRDEAMELLVRHLRGHEYPAPFLDQLLRRGVGNPRYLSALGDAFADPHAAGVLAGRTLPTTILGHVMAALDATPLTPGATLGLEAAAALDAHASRARLAKLVAQSGAVVTELMDARLLREAERRTGALAFTNPLYQEAAYERTLVKNRRELHERIAAILEAEGMPPAVVAEHFVQADRAPDAAWHLMLAAEACLEGYSNQEARTLVDAAGTWVDKAGELCPYDVRRRLLKVRSAAAAAQGDMVVALEASEAVLAMSREVDPEPRAWHAHLMLRQGKPEEGMSWAIQGLSLPTTPPQRAHLRALLADAHLMRAEYPEVLELVRQVEAEGEHVPPRYRAWLLRVGGVAHMRLRDHAAARTMQVAALAMAQEAADLYGTAHALNNLGSVLEALGELDTAARRFVQGLQVAERIGDRRLKSMLMNNLGMVRYAQADVPAAMDCFASALEAHREIHDRNGEGIALTNLGEITLELGDVARAAGLLFEAVMVLEEVGNKNALAEAYRLLAPLKARQGAHEEALQLAQRGVAIAAQAGPPAAVQAAFAQLCTLAREIPDQGKRTMAIATARTVGAGLGEQVEELLEGLGV